MGLRSNGLVKIARGMHWDDMKGCELTVELQELDHYAYSGLSHANAIRVMTLPALDGDWLGYY